MRFSIFTPEFQFFLCWVGQKNEVLNKRKFSFYFLILFNYCYYYYVAFSKGPFLCCGDRSEHWDLFPRSLEEVQFRWVLCFKYEFWKVLPFFEVILYDDGLRDEWILNVRFWRLIVIPQRGVQIAVIGPEECRSHPLTFKTTSDISNRIKQAFPLLSSCRKLVIANRIIPPILLVIFSFCYFPVPLAEANSARIKCISHYKYHEGMK